MSGICYDVSPFEGFLWSDHKRVEPGCLDAEREGRKRYEAFDSWCEDSFSDLLSGGRREPLDPQPTGSEWAARLHELRREVPEWGELAERCEGNDYYAGMGTAALADTILQNVAAPQDQIGDPRTDEEALGYLQRLLEAAENREQREAAEEAIREYQDRAEQKKNASAEHALDLDETEVRTAVRRAAKRAKQEIGETEKITDAFAGIGQGTTQHDGRRSRADASKKLKGLLAGNARIREIAEHAGRLRRLALRKQEEKGREGTDEIDGVTTGREPERLLPTELMYLADDDLEPIFDRGWAENSLDQWELKDAPKKQQGPIVMLLDSSGSMGSGDADVWAAAVALAFLEIAQRQQRAFALLHFGTSTLRKDVFPADRPVPVEEVVSAVTFFAASGGTAFNGVLDDALSVIEGAGEFESADIIMVTDGGAHVSQEWAARFEERRARSGVDVQTILVGNHAYKSDVEKIGGCVFLRDAVGEEEKMHHLFEV